MLQLEYAITEEEFLNYNYFVGWKDPAKKKKRIKLYVITLACFVLLSLVSVTPADNGIIHPSSLIFIAIGFIVLVFLFLFRIRAVFDKQAKKLLEQPGGEVILSKTNITIEENGFFVKTKMTDAKFDWNAFQRKVIANNCYYLFVNARQAAIIPFSAFRSPEERKLFDDLLLKYLPLKAELKQFA